MARPSKKSGTKLQGGVGRRARATPPHFDLAVPDLAAELRRLLAEIPAGRVSTYGDLADALGLRAAARWVGEFLRHHEHGPQCACHRIVRKEGTLGLYHRGLDPAQKAARLRAEGVIVREDRVERFDEIVYRGFTSERPLARLIELQRLMANGVRLETYEKTPAQVAGLDVSYAPDGTAVGACALVETATGRLLWSITGRLPAGLPYIPSLLTFRELPLLHSLFEKARCHFPDLDLFLVDGNGILHPRGGGVASCFGVVADVPTVGVAKSLLCGRVEPDAPAIEGCPPVSVDGKIVGAAYQRGPAAHRLYISPGQRIDVAGAVRIARLLDFGHRLPEPLFWADRLSRAEARGSANSSLL